MTEIRYKIYSLKESSDSLLKIWEEKSGKRTNLCCEKLCTNTDIEGVLVNCKNTNKNYLIPLCSEHRDSDREIRVSSNFELIEFKK